MTLQVVPTAATQTQLKELFLKNYEEIGTVYAACKKSGIKHRSTPYYWCSKDSEFQKKFTDVQSTIEDKLAQSLIETGQGIKAMTQPQVTSAIFMLKALNPRKYQEKFQNGFGALSGIKEIEIKTVEVRVRSD